MSERDPIQISEWELRQMTAELDERHQATLPLMRRSAAHFADNLLASRRGFLVSTGAVLGGLALAACGGDDKPTSTSTGGVSGTLEGDLKVVALAAALEIGAVKAYQAGIDAATAGKLGAVPPAVVTFATTAQAQHKDHAAAWNGVLKGAGQAVITSTANIPSVQGVIDTGLSGVTDVPSLARLALSLESIAAATYLSGLAVITDPGGIATAATIQPVEMQHVAILNFVLGTYPVPDAFAKVDGAISPEAFTG